MGGVLWGGKVHGARTRGRPRDAWGTGKTLKKMKKGKKGRHSGDGSLDLRGVVE